MRVAMETIVFYELIQIDAFLLSRPKMRECPSPKAAFSSSHFKFAGATNVCKIYPIHLWRRKYFFSIKDFSPNTVLLVSR